MQNVTAQKSFYGGKIRNNVYDCAEKSFRMEEKSLKYLQKKKWLKKRTERTVQLRLIQALEKNAVCERKCMDIPYK